MGKGGSKRWRKELRAAKKELRKAGIAFVGSTSGTVKALREAGLAPPNTKTREVLGNIWARNQKVAGEGLYSARTVSDFYQSPEWRRLAYKCKLRDGRRCMCCGATPDDGARIVSDHIIPLRLRWDLRLDENNIQTLCDECNKGKGSIDQTNFRKTRKPND